MRGGEEGEGWGIHPNYTTFTVSLHCTRRSEVYSPSVLMLQVQNKKGVCVY